MISTPAACGAPGWRTQTPSPHHRARELRETELQGPSPGLGGHEGLLEKTSVGTFVPFSLLGGGWWGFSAFIVMAACAATLPGLNRLKPNSTNDRRHVVTPKPPKLPEQLP